MAGDTKLLSVASLDLDSGVGGTAREREEEYWKATRRSPEGCRNGNGC
jgi:hypothetical protein